jgi:hypothetical protein
VAAYGQDLPWNSIETSPQDLARDVATRGLDEIDRLLDREAVIRDLLSPSWQTWPTPSYSHRIRLLPLLLASLGKTSEAPEAVRAFGSEASHRDQLLPSYAVFLRAFEGRFAV